MRSRFADHFNHDDQAAGYDADVADESQPIRAGYSAALEWVTDACASTASDRVLDLGCGTANLALRLEAEHLTCVDVSGNMLAEARAKLADREGVEFVQDDLLAYLDGRSRQFDVIASTYSVHHLTEDEKSVLFERVREALRPGGRAAFGDLMFADADARADFLAGLRSAGREAVAEAIEEEFFWFVDTAVDRLAKLGFRVESRHFAKLSWGIAAVLES